MSAAGAKAVRLILINNVDSLLSHLVLQNEQSPPSQGGEKEVVHLC